MLRRIALLLLLQFSLAVTAEEQLNNDFPHLTLVTENLPPLQYYDDNQALAGYAVEIVKAVMKTIKYPYTMKLYPWARSYKLIKGTPNVCIFSIARIPERESMFRWVGKMAETNSVIYGLKADNINFKTLEEAKQYNIAVIRDDVTHLILLENGFIEGKNLYIVNDTESLLNLMYSRPEIDLVVVDDVTLSFRAQDAGLDPNIFKRFITIRKSLLNFHLACSIETSPDVVDTLKGGLADIRKNGMLEQINNKWQDALGDAMIK